MAGQNRKALAAAKTDLAERVQVPGLPAGKGLQKATFFCDKTLYYESFLLEGNDRIIVTKKTHLPGTLWF